MRENFEAATPVAEAYGIFTTAGEPCEAYGLRGAPLNTFTNDGDDIRAHVAEGGAFLTYCGYRKEAGALNEMNSTLAEYRANYEVRRLPHGTFFYDDEVLYVVEPALADDAAFLREITAEVDAEDRKIAEARRQYRLGVLRELPTYAQWKTGRHAFTDATPWITIGKFFEDKPKCATIDPKVRSFIAAMIRTARHAGKPGFDGARAEINRRASFEQKCRNNIGAQYLYGIETIVRHASLRNTERFADYT